MAWFGPRGVCGCCDVLTCGCPADPEIFARRFAGTPTIKVEISTQFGGFTYRGSRVQSAGVSYFIDDYTASDIDINGTYFIELPKTGDCIDGGVEITELITIGSFRLSRETGTVPWVPSPAECASPAPHSTTVFDYDVIISFSYSTSPGPNVYWYQVSIGYRIGTDPGVGLMLASTRCVDNYVFNKDGNPGFIPPFNNSYAGKLGFSGPAATGICGLTDVFEIDLADCTLTIEDL